jgi:hypothetical protein
MHAKSCSKLELHEDSTRTDSSTPGYIGTGADMMIRLRRAAAPLLLLPLLLGQERSGSSEQPDAKIWIGRYREIEEYLRTAECVSITTFGANRAARCNLPPGGPVARMSWKALPPGIYRGFRESYKAEIAAYEMDKVLKLDMVPPTVERQLDGNTGAAQVWVENIVDLKKDGSPEEARRSKWEEQLLRMAMFDDLIGVRDRNLGNMLRDASWQLVLIDHSRAFTASTDLPRKLTKVDRALWDVMEQLTRAQLDTALKPWLDDDEIAAVIERREKMRAEIKSLPK